MMIEVTNICPICEKQTIFRFHDKGRDDLPDGLWQVPCSACENTLAQACHVDTDMRGNMRFLKIYEGCLLGDPDYIETALDILAEAGA